LLPGTSTMRHADNLIGSRLMIFEMRTYRLQPGSVPEAEKRFGEALTERVKVSPLGAFFSHRSWAAEPHYPHLAL